MKFSKILFVTFFAWTTSAAFAISEGDMMPSVDIKGKDNVGKLDWTGKVTVLNFWATWCDACKVELKEMNTEFAPLHDRKDVLVGYVSLDKDPVKALSYLQEAFGIDAAVTTRIAHDSTFAAADQLGIDSFPMTLVIDRAGKIVKIQRGFKVGEGSTAALLKIAQSL